MANTIKVFAIILIILGVIGSFILGNELGRYEFNFYAFSAGLLSTALLGISMLGFSGILSFLEEIRDTEKNNERYIRQILDSLPSNNKQSQASKPYIPNTQSSNFINTENSNSSTIDAIRSTKTKICPKCGEMNNANKLFCAVCGSQLK